MYRQLGSRVPYGRTDGTFELVKGTTSYFHLVMPRTDHPELIIIPVITNRHYGLEKNTLHNHIVTLGANRCH